MVKSSMKTRVISTATITIIVNLIAIADVCASTDADYTFMITSDWHNCQRISSEYQEIYAFETDSFYVNICQKDDVYFYSGEAKQSDKPDDIGSPRSSIFIPAYPLEDDRGFYSENGNLSYIVLLPFGKQHNDGQTPMLEPAEAILTIKRNGQLVSVESSLNKYCHQSEDAIAFDTIEAQLQNYNQVATIPRQQDFGSDISFVSQGELLPPEIFKSDARFDFYRVGGELYRLTTCN